jgi:hypothetical protein
MGNRQYPVLELGHSDDDNEGGLRGGGAQPQPWSRHAGQGAGPSHTGGDAGGSIVCNMQQ